MIYTRVILVLLIILILVYYAMIVPLTSMEDVAEVVEWHHPECIGSIIQRLFS